MTVRARTEPNFRRARLAPRRRRRFRTLLSWNILGRGLGVALLALGLQQSVQLVLTTPLLRVDRVDVEGNVRLSTGQVQAMLEDLRGSNILRADLGAARERLAASPWIANAALRRVLPSAIEVSVVERHPIALCRVGQKLFLMDATGALLDEFGPQYAEFDLPIIDGVAKVAAGRTVLDARRVELAARVIGALSRSPDIARRLSQVDVSDADDAVVLLDGDPALLHLGRERFLERVQGYVDLAGALREGVPEIDYVDLRFGRHVYVRPAAGAGRASARQAPRAPEVRRF